MALPPASPNAAVQKRPMWLTRTGELESVRRDGKRFRTSLLEVRTLASALATTRVGLVVPRHHHTAVRRNRLKRQLRAAVRLGWDGLAAGGARDIVVRTAPKAYDAPYGALVADVERIGRRLGERPSAPTAGT